MSILTIAVIITTFVRVISLRNFAQKPDYYFVKSGSDAISALMKFESDITAFLIVAVSDSQFQDMSNPKSERNTAIASAEAKLNQFR